MFKDIPETIKELKKDYSIGILTSNLEESVKNRINNYNINVDFIFCGSSIFGKHHIIKRLLRENNLRKNEVIYVGDEIRDIKACKKVGINIISVTWGYNSKMSLKRENPNYLVDKPKELIEIIKKI